MINAINMNTPIAFKSKIIRHDDGVFLTTSKDDCEAIENLTAQLNNKSFIYCKNIDYGIYLFKAGNVDVKLDLNENTLSIKGNVKGFNKWVIKYVPADIVSKLTTTLMITFQRLTSLLKI